MLLEQGLPVLVIDDGSAPDEAETLRTLAEAHPQMGLIRREANGGKGAAMYTGFREAARLGYTHALQCDADGQHEPAAIRRFVELAQQHTEALIAGTPVYDGSVPPARLHGRRITNFFIRLETGGRCRCDGMCGFRLYPLAATLPLLERHLPAQRMGYDIQLLVEASWAGMEILEAPVKVVYPENGRSHFRMVRDNVAISLLHTKLCTLALLGKAWWPRRRKAPAQPQKG